MQHTPSLQVSATPTRSPVLDDVHQAPLLRRMIVRSAGATHLGRVRATNQDQFLIAGLTSALRIQQSSLPQAPFWYADEQGYLYVVADGMGGASGGEQASALAVSTIEELLLGAIRWLYALREPQDDQILGELRTALSRADARLFEEALRRPELKGMGTTLTLAYSLAGELFIAHVGDSRCYLLRTGQLHQLTRDHTVVGEMVRRGLIPKESAAQHQLRHVITNVVGGDVPGLKVEVHKVALASGDVLMLCSDGLTEMVSDEEIAVILGRNEDPRVACDELVRRANELGGTDNVTVVVSRHEQVG